MSPVLSLGAFAVGFLASVLGSLVGLGGGFIVVPVLRVFFGVPPAEVAGTSLILVFANTAATTLGFLRDRRIDFKLSTPFAVGAVPGSVGGVLLVHRFTPSGFDVAYGVLLLVLSFFVLRRRGVASRPEGQRTFADDPRVSVPAGLLIGFFSSLFGIGGGVVVVPLLLIAARMPPLVVTATSAFVITVTSPVGIIGHIASHDVDWALVPALFAGGIAGGSLGPVIARRLSSPTLITILAVTLMLAAVGLIARHLL